MKTKIWFKIWFFLILILIWFNLSFWYWNSFFNEIHQIPYFDLLTKEWQNKHLNFWSIFSNWFMLENKNKFEVQKNWDVLISLNEVLWKNLYSYFFKWFKNIYWIKNNFLHKNFEDRWNIILWNLKNDNFKNSCFLYFQKIKRLNNFPIIFNYSNYYIHLKNEDITNLITCYLLYNKDELTISWEINTLYWDARVHNVWKWLWYLEWIWKKWEVLSVYDKIWNQKWYKEWYAIFKKEWKYIHKLVNWWWLCWVSSVLYQWILNWYNSFNIKERLPHSEFRSTYYNYLWIDATIFWEWEKSTRDLKIFNKHSSSILIQWYDEVKQKRSWYKYWIILWSLLPFEKTYFKNDWIVWKCIKNWIYWKNDKLLDTIESCYQWWIHN